MAWNPSPEVQVARDAANRLGTLANTTVAQVAILYTTTDGRLGTVTFGQTKELCAEAKRLGDELYKQAYKFFED